MKNTLKPSIDTKINQEFLKHCFCFKMTFVFALFIIEFSAMSDKLVCKSVSDKGNSKYLGLPAVAHTRRRLAPLMDST